MRLLAPDLLADATFWFEPAASASAQRHDVVFYTLLCVSGFFFALVIAIMLLMVVVYRRRRGVPLGDRRGSNTPLELFWTGVPLLVVTVFFVIGFRSFVDLDTPPSDAALVDVEARQWAFSFTYPNGAVSDRLILEVDRPALLQLHALDVLHSVYIPAFRVQRNAVPGRTTELWFQPNATGVYPLLCTQYCGNGHAAMNTVAEVLDATHYAARIAELANIFVDPATKKPLPYAKVGERLYQSSGCSQCHSTDGTPGQGPTWQGLYKQDVALAVAPEGYSLKAGDDDAKWDAYLRESILDPPAKIVRGFQNVMPSAASQFSGSPYKDKKLAALVEFIKSLDNHGPGGKPKYYRPMAVESKTATGKGVSPISAVRDRDGRKSGQSPTDASKPKDAKPSSAKQEKP